MTGSSAGWENREMETAATIKDGRKPYRLIGYTSPRKPNVSDLSKESDGILESWPTITVSPPLMSASEPMQMGTSLPSELKVIWEGS